MSIIVKGELMPKTCFECFALDDNGDYPTCIISQSSRGYTFRVREKRMPDCPLVELPEKHGRLIDADKIRYEHHEKIGLGIDYGINENSYYDIAYKTQIDKMPTIVEAEDEA